MKTQTRGVIHLADGSEDSILLKCKSSQIDYGFKTMPTKIPTGVFVEIDKLILKCS